MTCNVDKLVLWSSFIAQIMYFQPIMWVNELVENVQENKWKRAKKDILSLEAKWTKEWSPNVNSNKPGKTISKCYFKTTIIFFFKSASYGYLECHNQNPVE